MKILVIGLGGCGARIADILSQQNERARSKRGLEIVTGAFAVSADTADLIDLVSIKADYRHRILVGAREFLGGGVDGNNEMGARVMREHIEMVLEEIKEARHFFETDAVIIVAGTGGGFGSGGMPVMVQRVKQRFQEIIVYAMAVLPDEVEENENARSIHNTAICLKSVSSVADGVILFDNNLYRENHVRGDFTGVNQTIVEPFYNLLCAGAEKRTKHIGAKLLDAGDIIQTVDGWTVIGSSRIDLPVGLTSILPGGLAKASSGTSDGIKAMDNAFGEISRLCKPEDAACALYLLSAPGQDINLDLIKELGDYIKKAAPNAIIRSGDYPVGRGIMEVTVILSRLADVARIRDFYTRSLALANEGREEQP